MSVEPTEIICRRLVGRTAVITGAGSGIGLATARRLASEGAHVVCADIDETAGKAAAEEVGGLFVKVDVTDKEDVDALFKTAFDTYGSVDIAFNNAGISPPDDDSILTTELDAWRRVQDVNLTSVYLCCKAALPYMQRQGRGSIINTASFVAIMGAATSQISYTASKGGVLAMSRELGVQFAREGIRVNALCPGPVNTPLLQELFAKDPERAARRLVHIPLGRFAEPTEIAAAVAFLASDDSSFINATDFLVDGGISGAYVTPCKRSPHHHPPDSRASHDARLSCSTARDAFTAKERSPMSPRDTTRRLQALAAAAITVAALVAVAPSAEAAHPGAPCTTPQLEPGWYGDNQARLQQLIDRYGRCNPYRPARARPVAVFDWDNTVVKNDVGDATMFWLLRNSRIRQPARGDWSTTSRFLTPAAAKALADACGALARPGTPLPTGTPAGAGCADEINAVYGTAATRTAAAAFAGWDRRTMEPGYAWLPQLMQGWTAREIRGFAAAARTENLAAPVGATQQVGTGRATGWVRYYDQQKDLIKSLRKAGFDVWISSASPQPVVEVWAEGVGIDADHVIGIRNTTTRGGVYTPASRAADPSGTAPTR